jgi:hypothetical protein
LLTASCWLCESTLPSVDPHISIEAPHQDAVKLHLGIAQCHVRVVELLEYCLALICLSCSAGRRGRRGRQGPPGPTCANPVRSPEWVCPATKLFNGRRKQCDDYACECKVTAYCPKGYYVSSCLCANSNPLTPVDLGPPIPDPMTGAASANVQNYGMPAEQDLRYPWVLTSSFNAVPMPGSPDSANPQGISECTCTWVNTIPLVSTGLTTEL